jgi:hypothetical protein
MNTKSAKKKLLLCKSLILIYFFVVAILPLSDIHVEYLGDQSGVTLDKTNHNIDKLIYLHEILFSHFGNNSDQARTSFPRLVISKISTNILRTNLAIKLNHLTCQDSIEVLLLCPHQNLTHIYSQTNTGKMLRGFPYLYSGLSPPLV